MNQKILLLFLVALTGFLPYIHTDVISVNGGGNTQLVISSNNYTEAAFFQPPICGNNFIESGEQCDDGNTNNGDGCSSVCVTETTTTTTSSGDAGGGGGGSGGSGSVSSEITSKSLLINPTELSMSVVQGIEETTEIMFTNKGQFNLVIALETAGDIKGILTTQENLFSLAPGQSKNLLVIVNADKDELLTGKIIVKYSGYVEEIPVVIASKTENFLFDISVYLGNSFKKIIEGNKISAQFNLIEVNLKEKVDVTATYVIKDFEGNKYYETSETFFVLGEKSYLKEFPTETLSPRKYVIGFEIVYPGAFASSSDTFEVADSQLGFDYRIILFLVLGVGLLFVIWIIWRIFFRKSMPDSKV